MEEGIIRKLDKSVINRIAAGEIIQRPANACKELIENSIDAKATQIQISVKNGGLKLLQVEDNGTGIHSSDLEIVCERFTTSKLKKFEDLTKIDTFGFRGEALASMSYVAHLFIQTKTAESPFGYRATYENGKLKELPKRCAAKQGTIIRIEDLFYNMQQRRQCLPSASDEYQKIYDVVSKYAVHHSHIAFMLKKNNEQPTLKTKINSTQEQNIRSIYGTKVADNLLRIELENEQFGEFKMKALITTLNYSGKSQNFILFINHRLVESIALKTAIESAYSAYIQKGMHPFAYVELELNPSNMDVNIHPTKTLVSFLYEAEIMELIRTELENHLSNSKDTRILYKQLKLSKVETVDNSSSNKDYEKNMVRTDATEQKLETFLAKAPNSVQAMETENENCLSSILKMKNEIKSNVCKDLRKKIKGHVFVGVLEKSFSLIQIDKSLCICDTLKLSEELFYQLLVNNFKKFSIIKVDPKLPIKNLMVLAIKNEYDDCNDEETEKLAEEGAKVLIHKAHIMREYFGLSINAEGELESLPLLLPNHSPSVCFLPKYLLDLSSEVDWTEEEKFFKTFFETTASFYATISDIEFETKNKEQTWTLEHVIYPAFKRYLQPPSFLNNHIYQVTTIPKLYKVFERC